MDKASSTDTEILSVSVVAGPAAGALLVQHGALEQERSLILPAGTIALEGEEALEQLGAIAEQREVEHLLIECDSQVPAMAYASLFLSPPLSETAKVTRAILVIRPSHLLQSLVPNAGDVDLGSPCFFAEQLEFVNEIVLEGGKEDPDSQLAREIALTLNPGVKVSDLTPDTLQKMLASPPLTSFDFGAALDAAGWRKLIDGEKLPHPGKNNLASFAYRARRPFHPERFLNLVQSGLPGVFRAKGFFWLATRMDLVGGVNLAGSELHCAGAGEWWATRDEHTRQHEMPERTRKEWQEPFGDRRQAIAFMGIDFDPEAFKAQLDACLLTDPEMAAGPESWASLADPFPSWTTHSHTHKCDHDHDHDHEAGGHDCCHH